MKEEEFFGKLEIKLVNTDKTRQTHNELIDWVIVNPDSTRNREREIEDGDFLQVFDSNGNVVLNKVITRDYKTLYNQRYGKQLYNGMAVRWLPLGVDTGYWSNLFFSSHRARIVKQVNE